LSKLNLAVTTSRKADGRQQKSAQELAQRLGLTFFLRQEISLKELNNLYQGLIVVEAEKIVLKTLEAEFFFHPNMAKLRISNIRQGQPDHLILALDLQEGDSLLDGTLGLAGDAITASFWLKKKGTVIGLEVVPLIYEIVSYGLAHSTLPDQEIEEAMRRIRVFNIHYLDYLKKLPDQSIDIIYFDPMFDRTIIGASSILSLRELAEKESLVWDALQEAKRAARKRVVMKSRKGSQELVKLGFTSICGGKYSKVEYGYFSLGE